MQDPIQDVKRYLAEKEYDKARTVLQISDHPKSEEWLRRVDALQRMGQVDSIPKPWNPGWIGWLTLLTPIVSTLILAWNWRRFDRKSWTWWTILGFILLVPLVIGLAIVSLFLPELFDPSVKVTAIFIYSSVITLFLLIIFYPFLISGRQAQAYKLIKQKNIYAAYDHHYDWGRGILIWILSALLFAGALTWMIVRDDDHVDTETIRLTVPFVWDVNDPDYDCDYFDNGCSFVLSGNFSGLNISFHEGGWIEGYETNQEVADSMWNWANESAEFTPINRETIEIGGRKAFVVRYFYNDWYWVDIYLKEGSANLRILVEGHNQRVVDNNWNEILALLNSMEWTP